MSDDNTEAAAMLRKLGERVRAGWAKLHPVSDKHLAAVRAAVAKQWEQEHGEKSRFFSCMDAILRPQEVIRQGTIAVASLRA